MSPSLLRYPYPKIRAFLFADPVQEEVPLAGPEDPRKPKRKNTVIAMVLLHLQLTKVVVVEVAPVVAGEVPAVESHRLHLPLPIIAHLSCR